MRLAFSKPIGSRRARSFHQRATTFLEGLNVRFGTRRELLLV